jgi:hypothetical protein
MQIAFLYPRANIIAILLNEGQLKGDIRFVRLITKI